ncbi:hypothetical protein XELAEV_18033566mg [Xenopus laevis]|uniref:GIY-YIG domain-containing protein n=1 Tax=Xenopus laevis TaxID=8355 RepID=A0A974HEJ1_XENLA|nr:hypothetical protein XELAEV_18033566mg [Xenopus laevis]
MFRSVYSHTKEGKNIANSLVRAEQNRSEHNSNTRFLATPKNGTFPCLNCSKCNSTIKGEYITHPYQGHKIPITQYNTCHSDHVIYGLNCPCGKLYVGQTTRAVKVRIGEHKRSIGSFDPNNKKTHTSVGRHFSNDKHSAISLKWMALHKQEAKWIELLNTIEPKGMNEDLSWKCFL